MDGWKYAQWLYDSAKVLMEKSMHEDQIKDLVRILAALLNREGGTVVLTEQELGMERPMVVFETDEVGLVHVHLIPQYVQAGIEEAKRKVKLPTRQSSVPVGTIRDGEWSSTTASSMLNARWWDET